MDTLIHTYLFKAMDAYPYDLAETIEALNYALSYNHKNTKALCLMGRVYAEQLADYESAKTYYAEALAENMHAIDVYPYYISVLLWNDDLVEAEKLINFAFTVKGIDKGTLYHKKALLLEKRLEYKLALHQLKLAKTHGYNSDFIYFIKNESSRIKDKMPKKKVKTKAKNKKKKKK